MSKYQVDYKNVNGRILFVSGIEEVPDTAESCSQEFPRHEWVANVFDTYEEAEKNYKYLVNKMLGGR